MLVLDERREGETPRTERGRASYAGLDGAPPFERWVRAQVVNAQRHIGALRPMTRDDFRSPSGVADPSEGHIRAVNELIDTLRVTLNHHARTLRVAAATAARSPGPGDLDRFLSRKDRVLEWVQAIERIYDFYGELFGQRQAPAGMWLAACDRIALDCYQVAFVGIGIAKSIPAPAPYCYMRTGFSPATFRRGIPLRRLGQRINPFPLIELPMHRLTSPWTLGAILHEVSHSLQNELGLARHVPARIVEALRASGASENAIPAIARMEREVFADLAGTLLGGPAVVASLFDVIGRSPRIVFAYDPRGVHPPPDLRAQVSVVLLRRMGFPRAADRLLRIWRHLFPDPSRGSIPADLRRNFRRRAEAIVDAVCYRPYRELGGKALAQVLRFGPKDQQMAVEAAHRMAVGIDPGVIPERYLIGAARIALDRRLASPGAIARHFYDTLLRR